MPFQRADSVVYLLDRITRAGGQQQVEKAWHSSKPFSSDHHCVGVCGCRGSIE